MATKEIYDYVSSIAADYTATELAVIPQRVMTEVADKKQVLHEYDSGVMDVISFSDTTFFNVTLVWEAITESDAGTIFDLYADSAKANGREKTFYFQHPDGHTYTVRFLGPLQRIYTPSLIAGGRRGIDTLTLRVEGRKP